MELWNYPLGEKFIKFSPEKDMFGQLRTHHEPPPLHPIDPSLTQKKNIRGCLNRHQIGEHNNLSHTVDMNRYYSFRYPCSFASSSKRPRLLENGEYESFEFAGMRQESHILTLKMVLRLIEGVVQPSSGCKYMLIATMHNKKKLIAT